MTGTIALVVIVGKTPTARCFRVPGSLGAPVPDDASVLIDLARTTRARPGQIARLAWRCIPAREVFVTGTKAEHVAAVVVELRAEGIPAEPITKAAALALVTGAETRPAPRRVDVNAGCRNPQGRPLRVGGTARRSTAVVRIAFPVLPLDDECERIAARLVGVSVLFLTGYRTGCETFAGWLDRHRPEMQVHLQPAPPVAIARHNRDRRR